MKPHFHLPATARIDEQHMPDGARIRTLLWPRENARANLLVLTGRADFLEKWADATAELHAAGFAIASFDWRGQGSSTRLTANGAGHIDSFDSWVDDLGHLADWAAGALPDGRWFTLAHSMGGQILMRWLGGGHWRRSMLAPRIAGAMLMSPLFDIHGAAVTNGFLRLAARVQSCRGRGADYAWRQTPYGPAQQSPERQQQLTSSRIRFDDEARWLHARPELATGGVSWGWIDAFARSRAAMRRAPLEELNLPVLALLAENERVVDNAAALRALARLPAARCAVMAGAAHEILRESDRVRAAAQQCISGFVQEVLHDA